MELVLRYDEVAMVFVFYWLDLQATTLLDMVSPTEQVSLYDLSGLASLQQLVHTNMATTPLHDPASVEVYALLCRASAAMSMH